MKWYAERYFSIINKRIRLKINERLQETTLNEANFYYLIILDEQPGLSQSELTQQVNQDQSVVTRHVNHLVNDGWLEKQPNRHDRRQSKLYLTPMAHEFIPTLETIIADVSNEMLEELTAEETDQLYTLLQKIVSYHDKR